MYYTVQVHVCMYVSTKCMWYTGNLIFNILINTVGGGVANNLIDASHLPHLVKPFLVPFYTRCELTDWSTRRDYSITSSIRQALSLQTMSQT